MSLVRAARPLNPWVWLGAPALACVAATIVLSAPIRIFGFALPEPVFGMVLAFAWPAIRPAVLAPFALVAYGVFTDLFWGAPTGLWGLSLLAAYGAALFLRQLMQGQSWQALWLWYAAFTALAMGAAYFLASLSALNPPGFTGVTWQYVATVALYPFAHRLIERFEDADVRFR